MKGAFVTYSNEAKIRQGVPAQTISRYSVYSRETAAEMAKACAEAYGADIGIGVTGMKSISLSQIIDNCRFFENGEYITAVYSADRDFEIEIRDALL